MSKDYTEAQLIQTNTAEARDRLLPKLMEEKWALFKKIIQPFEGISYLCSWIIKNRKDNILKA